MKLLRNLIANIVIYAFLLGLFDYLKLGIQIDFVDGNLLVRIALLIAMGGVFWVLNSPLKWIIQTLSFPVNMLTLGLFSLVINVAIFYLFEWVMNRYFAPDVKVQLGNILQTLVLSLIMAVGSGILKKIV